MGAPAHEHDLLHRKREDAHVDLRNVGRVPSTLAHREAMQRLAVQPDVAGERRDETEHGFQERGLAAAVGPEQRQHLARSNRQINPVRRCGPGSRS